MCLSLASGPLRPCGLSSVPHQGSGGAVWGLWAFSLLNWPLAPPLPPLLSPLALRAPSGFSALGLLEQIAALVASSDRTVSVTVILGASCPEAHFQQHHAPKTLEEASPLSLPASGGPWRPPAWHGTPPVSASVFTWPSPFCLQVLPSFIPYKDTCYCTSGLENPGSLISKTLV